MLAEKQEWFTQLSRQSVGNSEACYIVGVNRRTGTRWRYGRTILNTVDEAVHYPAVTSRADNYRRSAMRRHQRPREIRRNTDERGRYLPAAAQRLSTERRRRVRPR